MKKITKIIAGVSTFTSAMYWNVLPAFAAPLANTNLCPTLGGVSVPGCGGTAIGINEVIQFGVNVLLFISFIAALGYLIYGGLRWIMSGGDKEGTAKAKGTVTAALIGLVIVLAAWVLINFILQLITGGSLGTINLPNLRGS